MLDDDMQMSALSTTGIIKNLVTAEIPVDVEAKGFQSEQAILYPRFLCFGNVNRKLLFINRFNPSNIQQNIFSFSKINFSEIPVDVEAKGFQSEQAVLYPRFLCFGNGSPKVFPHRRCR